MNALRTTVAHQFVSYPCFYFPSFFYISELVRGGTLDSAGARLKQHFPRLYKLGLVVWTPAMLLQFYFVPLHLQVLYISACSFAWTTFLCWSAL